jgi:anti-anti-sigma factor
VIGVSQALRDSLASFSTKHEGTVLSLVESSYPRALCLSVDGVLDANDSQEFLVLGTLIIIESKAFGGLVVELSRLGYISSQGVGALVNMLTEAKRRDLPFYLKALPAHARTIFDLLGFTAFFTILAAEDERP